jgi:hypothetical protein
VKLIGELASRITPKQWIEIYTKIKQYKWEGLFDWVRITMF